MKKLICSAVVLVGLATSAVAQMTPWVVPFNGVATNFLGQPMSGPVSMTFAIFEESTGGAPLWVEVQVVQADAQGNYVAFLGSSTDGLPTDLLSGGAARWLSAKPDSEPEMPRVQLLSVPYSLKAADAETLGGLPASAFLTANGTGSGALSSPSGESAPTPDNADLLAGSGEGGTLTASSGDGLIDVSGDQVILDDLIVDGSACLGFDCVNGESFGFDTLRLKENNLRIKAQDTSSTSSFPTQDWQITFNDTSNGGLNKFSIDAISPLSGTPFTIEASSGSHHLYVDDGGRVGFGTNTPVADLHVKTGNTPTLRLEQDGSSGFGAQTWDVAGNEANFFIRDATNGSTLPFRILPGAPSSAIYIAATGNVGMGNSSPSAALHVLGGGSSFGALAGTMALFQNSAAASSSVFVSMLSGTTGNNQLTFGDTDNQFAARVVYEHDTGSMDLRAEQQVEFNTGADVVRIQQTADTNLIETTAGGAFGTGALLTSAGVWQSVSRRSAKENIRPLSATEAMNAFFKLEPVTYNYKVAPGDPTVGFIADDVPDLVATESRQHLAPLDLIAVVTKVVQEQATVIQTQQDQIQTLTDQLQALTQRVEALNTVP